MTVARVGFVGLGSQGGPIAERILAGGIPLTVWARRPEVAEEWLQKGATIASSLFELGQQCDHIGICVVDDSGVAEICQQLIPAMQPGSLLVIHSTISPESCEALASLCAERCIDFLDAPVSGGGPAAAAGTLTVMCGGSETAFEKAHPVLNCFAGYAVLLGPAGSGQRAKIVNNALMAACTGISHSAIMCGEALGINRTALLDLIKVSSGRSFAFEMYANLPSPSAFAHAARLLTKDVGLLCAALPGQQDAQNLNTAAKAFLELAMAQESKAENLP